MKLLHLFVGILLIPLSGILLMVAAGLLRSLTPEDLARPEYLIGGAGTAVGLIWYHSAWRPMRFLILGHELTHALWSILTGGTAHRLRTGRHGGSVEVSESGPLVTLAPYFFPMYALLLAGLYALLNLFLDLTPYRFLWLTAIGLSLGLHAGFTLSSLRHGQSDLAAHGVFFSWMLILTLNLLVVIIGLVALGRPTTGQALHLFSESGQQAVNLLQSYLTAR